MSPTRVFPSVKGSIPTNQKKKKKKRQQASKSVTKKGNKIVQK